MKAGQLDRGGHLPISEYAIQFYVVSSEPYRPIALAKVVLEFMKTWTNEEEGIHLELVKLCYKFGEAGVMGVMFINGALESPCEEAEWMASAGVSGYESHGVLPVSFWPSGTTCRVTDGTYTALIEHTRELYERHILQGSAPLQDITNQSEDNDENVPPSL